MPLLCFLNVASFQPAQWTNGWTEENATEHCNDFFNNRESVDSCQNIIAFFPENAIENCISDIFVSKQYLALVSTLISLDSE